MTTVSIGKLSNFVPTDHELIQLRAKNSDKHKMRTIVLLLLWISLHSSLAYQIVYPRKVPLTRLARSASNELQQVNIDTGQQSDSFSLYLKRNKQLLTGSAVIEWHYPNGTKQELNLLDVSLSYL